MVAVVMDGNRNDVSGDGGDGTNIAKIYIYTSGATDGTTWTLRATVTTDVVGTSKTGIYSSCIGPDNNIHIGWQGNTGNLMYVMVTYAAGPAYTVGTIRTLYTAGTGPQVTAVDIDVFGDAGQNCIVAAQCQNGTAAQTTIRTYLCLTGGSTTFNPWNFTTSSTSNLKSHVSDITISTCKDTIVSNIGTVFLMFNRGLGSGDTGDKYRVLQWNVSTGAQTFLSSEFTRANGGQAAGRRRWLSFCSNGAREFVVGYTADMGTYVHFGAWSFSINDSGVMTDILPLTSADTPKSYVSNLTRGFSWSTCVWTGNTSKRLVFVFSNVNFQYATVADMSGAATIYQTLPLLWAGISSAGRASGSLTSVAAGNTRNFASNRLDVADWYGRDTTYKVFFDGFETPLTPGNLVPTDTLTVTTDEPILSATFGAIGSQMQSREKMVWQVASDAGFTTALKTIYASTLLVVNASTPKQTAQIDDINQLNQGTWYVRVAAIDEIGNQGPWSPTNTFTVAHPPAAANMYPTGSDIYIYGAGSIPFHFKFTDPSPFDFMTAYQIIVKDSATLATIVDTGKVTASADAQSNGLAMVTIPVGNKDTQLQWTVALWDRDDVQGPTSDAQTFIVSDAPTPALTSPTGTITTSSPTASWTPGVGAIKIQKSYRIQVAQGSKIIWDSTTTVSTVNSVIVPAGKLHNANTYTFTLTITDSYGLVGVTTSTATVSVTPPAIGDLHVYFYEFDRKGFVFCGWTEVNIDANYLSWNLYRKAVGDTEWTLLYSTTDSEPSHGFRDYSAASNTRYQYIVSQKSMDLSGDIVESVFTGYLSVQTPGAMYYLLDSEGVEDGVPLFSASADQFIDEQEQETFTILDRGRHTDVGTDLGANGTLTLKLRDKFIGQKLAYNLFQDPAIQSHQLVEADPDYWTVSGIGSFATLSHYWRTFYEPAPDGKLRNFTMKSSALGNTTADALTIAQAIPNTILPAGSTQLATTLWTVSEPEATNVGGTRSYKAVVQCYNAANSLIGTSTQSLTLLETYEPSPSGDLLSGNFKRYGVTHTLTALTDHVIVTFQIFTNTAGQVGEILAGLQAEAVAVANPYIDGDLQGAQWTGSQYASSSFSSGYYTARDQRLEVVAMRKLNRPLFLRSPFGDRLYVNLLNPSYTRDAGFGAGADYGSLEIPYEEVAF